MPHPFLYTHMPNNFSFIIVIEIEGRSEILAGRGALLKWPGGNTGQSYKEDGWIDAIL